MRVANVLRITGAVVATVLLASTAHAQLFRAYLSPTGNDANNCTLATPCRLLPAALTAVAGGGEIWMLGSANYNTATVSIAKSVSILAVPGAVGSVVATGGTAISINTAGVKVALRNLMIVALPGTGGNTSGIAMLNGTSLTVDSCLIANMTGAGIAVSGATKVRIVDSLVRDNGSFGVVLESGSTADISGTRLLGNGVSGVFLFGATAGTTTTAAISDSVLSGNDTGIDVSALTGATARVSVSRSTISNNNVGIIAGQNAVVVISDNLVAKNSALGLSQGGTGILESQGNNTVRQNGVNTAGTITPAPGI